MKKLLPILCLLGVMLLSQSCASIVTKSSYPVTFTSHPTAANVKVSDRNGFTVFSGTTPATVTLRSSAGFFTKATYVVEYSKPGYETARVLLDARIEGWYFANILIGGLIGMLIIDPATGAMWTLDSAVFQELRPTTPASSLQVMDIEDVPEELKSSLVKLN